jgi:hypothetical protein
MMRMGRGGVSEPSGVGEQQERRARTAFLFYRFR